jgi:hypothetical protein
MADIPLLNARGYNQGGYVSNIRAIREQQRALRSLAKPANSL